MSENITFPTDAASAPAQEIYFPPPVETPVAPAAAPEAAPQAPVTPVEPEGEEKLTAAQLRAELTKARNQAAGYRTKLREAEPIVEEYNKQREAEKTDLERANERIAELEIRDLKSTYSLTDEDLNFLGSGTREELEARAQHLGQLRANITPAETKAPPTDRPVESLRPGASPQPQQVEDNSYPAAWRPAARERS